MEVTSDIKQIPYPQQMVYDVLSNPSRLEKLRDALPEDKRQKAESVQFTEDSITAEAPGVGAVTLNIIERDAPKTIKFEANISMVKGNMWIQLLPTSDTASKMKVTIKADVPFFLKGMVKKPLTEAVGKVAEMLAMIPYQAF